VILFIVVKNKNRLIHGLGNATNFFANFVQQKISNGYYCRKISKFFIEKNRKKEIEIS